MCLSSKRLAGIQQRRWEEVYTKTGRRGTGLFDTGLFDSARENLNW
jgi:hypothetical protein